MNTLSEVLDPPASGELTVPLLLAQKGVPVVSNHSVGDVPLGWSSTQKTVASVEVARSWKRSGPW